MKNGFFFHWRQRQYTIGRRPGARSLLTLLDKHTRNSIIKENFPKSSVSTLTQVGLDFASFHAALYLLRCGAIHSKCIQYSHFNMLLRRFEMVGVAFASFSCARLSRGDVKWTADCHARASCSTERCHSSHSNVVQTYLSHVFNVCNHKTKPSSDKTLRSNEFHEAIWLLLPFSHSQVLILCSDFHSFICYSAGLVSKSARKMEET